MANGELQGWFADPFGLHEQRYFSAGHATKLVRDGSVESYDEPPLASLRPAGLGPLDTGYDPIGADSGGPSPGLRGRRAMRRFTLVYTASVLAVAAIVAIVLGHAAYERHQLAVEELAFVTRSAQHTLSERTADVAVTGTVQASGHTVTVTGTGEVDFSTDAEALNAQFSADGQQVVEKEVITRGRFYYTLSVNGTSFAKLTGGRDWVQVPLPSSSSANLSGSDSRSVLILLEQSGDTVRALGEDSIGGITCTGYSVTPTQQAMTAAARQEISVLKLSPDVASAIRSVLSRISPPTLTVWVDSQGLLRQLSGRVQIGSLAGAVTSEVVENFSNFGGPVHVAAPPTRDVVSYRAFLRDALYFS